MSDPLTTVVEAVQALVDHRDRLIAACTAPDATDLAEFLLTVREAREQLYREVEQVLEDACARAMLDDYAEGDGLRVERYRSPDRKAWDHDAWQRDVRAQALRAAGLAGLQGVLDANGELLPPSVVYEVLTRVQSVHGSAAPKTSKTSGLRSLGLDPADYCETSPGVRHVRVQRVAEADTEGAA